MTMPMTTFFTITNQHTHETNSRSKRYNTIEEAATEAQRRLANKETEGVIILKAVEIVTLAQPVLPPIKREPILS